MEGFDLFEELLNKIDEQIAEFLLKANIEQNTEIKQTITGIANDGKQKAKSVPKKNEHKVGRNDPCICGSGKKYKNCCGK
jgi:preprotein translocase subunit SecA